MRYSLSALWDKLKFLNCKTIYFNLKYFPFRQAVLFPVVLSSNTKLRITRGKVILPEKIRSGMIKIGDFEIGHYDKRHNRPVWENSGTVVFKGDALIKHGAKLIVGENGYLELGDKFRLSSGSFIICYKKIIIGSNCRISWDTQLLDSDFHQIFDSEGIVINPDKEILIEENCWIGNRCTINKGTKLSANTVVAGNSLTNKQYAQSTVILAGIPAKVIRSGISWGGDLNR